MVLIIISESQTSFGRLVCPMHDFIIHLVI